VTKGVLPQARGTQSKNTGGSGITKQKGRKIKTPSISPAKTGGGVLLARVAAIKAWGKKGKSGLGRISGKKHATRRAGQEKAGGVPGQGKRPAGVVKKQLEVEEGDRTTEGQGGGKKKSGRK